MSSNLSFKIENGDLVFDQDMVLQMTEDIAQSYTVLFGTQYESDFRDYEYGFKLQELIQDDYDNKDELLKLYAIETAMQHPYTDKVMEITVTDIGNRKRNVEMIILLMKEENQIKTHQRIDPTE